MLSKAVQIATTLYGEDIAQMAFQKLMEAEGGLDWPLHWLFASAEKLDIDEWRHQQVRKRYTQYRKAGGPAYGRHGRPAKYCPLKALLRLADTPDPELRVMVRKTIRGIEAEVTHGHELFRHLLGLDVTVSPATISRAKAEAMAWLRAKAAYEEAVEVWLR
jgi:DNA-directed RNA polymerase specialized sigma24 family protein